jgi:hypothetical protein
MEETGGRSALPLPHASVSFDADTPGNHAVRVSFYPSVYVPARACVLSGKTSETTKSPIVNSISTDNGDKSCDGIQLLCSPRRRIPKSYLCEESIVPVND